jgi:phenylpyruvate tautomerase PptA (4-oxalocrotonate tautomerase family)
MSLHRIYHPLNAFSAADKQGLAERITALYTAIGLPAFYVNVIFVSTEANSFFVGGQAKDKYIQIVIQHLATQLQNDETKKIIMEKYEKAILPFIKEKGYDWEVCYTFFHLKSFLHIILYILFEDSYRRNIKWNMEIKWTHNTITEQFNRKRLDSL